jgi:hypothetical protein
MCISSPLCFSFLVTGAYLFLSSVPHTVIPLRYAMFCTGVATEILNGCNAVLFPSITVIRRVSSSTRAVCLASYVQVCIETVTTMLTFIATEVKQIIWGHWADDQCNVTDNQLVHGGLERDLINYDSLL